MANNVHMLGSQSVPIIVIKEQWQQVAELRKMLMESISFYFELEYEIKIYNVKGGIKNGPFGTNFVMLVKSQKLSSHRRKTSLL